MKWVSINWPFLLALPRSKLMPLECLLLMLRVENSESRVLEPTLLVFGGGLEITN